MIETLLISGGLLLAWAFGRNNFSNVFGSAVGTGILSFKLASVLTGIFLLAGACFTSSGISNTLSDLVCFNSLFGAFSFSVIVALIMIFLTHHGIPASIAQISIGALLGWNFALEKALPIDSVIDIILGWFYSPIISGICAFTLFKLIRYYLKEFPISILKRDIYVRVLWIFTGSFTAYSLGANNLPVLTIPFVQVIGYSSGISVLFSLSVILGCLMASRRVIKMVSSNLFPLSSVESLIAGFSGALTLLAFSFQNGIFPALPISIGAAMVGAIVGISFAKGGYGLKGKALFSIVFSWIWAPILSGLICFGFITMIARGIISG